MRYRPYARRRLVVEKVYPTYKQTESERLRFSIVKELVDVFGRTSI